MQNFSNPPQDWKEREEEEKGTILVAKNLVRLDVFSVLSFSEEWNHILGTCWADRMYIAILHIYLYIFFK